MLVEMNQPPPLPMIPGYDIETGYPGTISTRRVQPPTWKATNVEMSPTAPDAFKFHGIGIFININSISNTIGIGIAPGTS